MANLKIEDVDQLTKDIVFGFIRECEKLLLNNDIYIIPSIIYHICINYYWMKEYFTLFGKHMKLNDEKNIIQNIDNFVDTAYGNIQIDNKLFLYEWNFKIIKHFAEIAIGIESSNKHFIDGRFTNKDQNENEFYAMNHDGIRYSNKVREQFASYDISRENGGTVKMIVNVKNKTISFVIDNKSLGIVFDDINFKTNKYNLAVYIGNQGGEIELVSFTQTSIR